MNMKETFSPIMVLRRAIFFSRLHVGNKEKKLNKSEEKEEDGKMKKKGKKHEHERETNFQLCQYSSLFSFSSLL